MKEFLAREEIAGCETGITRDAQLRWIAWVKAPEEVAPLIQKALRPPRASPAG